MHLGDWEPGSTPLLAVNGWREDVGIDDGFASFVVRGFDPAKSRSKCEARWLVQQSGDEFQLRAGDTIVVSAGPRPVGRFLIEWVDPAESAPD